MSHTVSSPWKMPPALAQSSWVRRSHGPPASVTKQHAPSGCGQSTSAHVGASSWTAPPAASHESGVLRRARPVREAARPLERRTFRLHAQGEVPLVRARRPRALGLGHVLAGAVLEAARPRRLRTVRGRACHAVAPVVAARVIAPLGRHERALAVDEAARARRLRAVEVRARREDALIHTAARGPASSLRSSRQPGSTRPWAAGSRRQRTGVRRPAPNRPCPRSAARSRTCRNRPDSSTRPPAAGTGFGSHTENGPCHSPPAAAHPASVMGEHVPSPRQHAPVGCGQSASGQIVPSPWGVPAVPRALVGGEHGARPVVVAARALRLWAQDRVGHDIRRHAGGTRRTDVGHPGVGDHAVVGIARETQRAGRGQRAEPVVAQDADGVGQHGERAAEDRAVEPEVVLTVQPITGIASRSRRCSSCPAPAARHPRPGTRRTRDPCSSRRGSSTPRRQLTLRSGRSSRR